MIECVPNFSEGRDPDFMEAIHEAILNGTETMILDQSADPDHNRSVFTLAGNPESLTKSVFQFTRAAIERIDMRSHKGVHPCIGAVDVIPFIPLRNTMLSECIALSESIAKLLADSFEMPIYLYGKSARIPEHRRLADIRRGGYATLAREIRSEPVRHPDFGPAALPPYGACSVGARNFLIAWNIYLNTADIGIAKEIAEKIRESSGGLKGVQAIGLPVKGRAQVSMNITDFHAAPLIKVYESVDRLASKAGTGILYSELIGLLPQAALAGSSAEELKIIDFSPERIIENRLLDYYATNFVTD